MEQFITTAGALKYSQLQMAAEAFIRKNGTFRNEGRELEIALTEGNGHASKFTATQAAAFAAEWIVVDQRENTDTGFSGTLFRNRTTDELVISLRSTEFADDFVRDNKATNELEISRFGFAFGQLRDLEQWYDELRSEGGPLAGGQPVAVTGYSLGGHLATAFNLMQRNNGVGQVITFNGAGIGQVEEGHHLAVLIAGFAARSTSTGGAEFGIVDATLLAIYDRTQVALRAGGAISAVDRAELLSLGNASAEERVVDAQTRADARRIFDAVARAETVARNVGYVEGISDSRGRLVNRVGLTSIEQTRLEYQMAVLDAGQHTSEQGYLAGWTKPSTARRTRPSSSRTSSTSSVIPRRRWWPIRNGITRESSACSSRTSRCGAAASASTP